MKSPETYEVPEIFELGDANKITLGQTMLPKEDNCNCSRAASAEEESSY